MYKDIEYIIRGLCDKNPVIFELGVQDGYFTHKYYEMAFGKPEKYYAFEPNPVNINKIKANGTFPKDVILVERAIGSKNGKVIFYQSSGHPIGKPDQEYEGCSSIREPKVVKDKLP